MVGHQISRISGHQISGLAASQYIWPDIRLCTVYLVGFPALYRISGRTSGLVPYIWLDIRLGTVCLAGYPAWYRISGRISGLVPYILPDIRLCTVYLAGYPAWYRISGRTSVASLDFRRPYWCFINGSVNISYKISELNLVQFIECVFRFKMHSNCISFFSEIYVLICTSYEIHLFHTSLF